jgi:hypothetical protein
MGSIDEPSKKVFNLKVFLAIVFGVLLGVIEFYFMLTNAFKSNAGFLFFEILLGTNPLILCPLVFGRRLILVSLIPNVTICSMYSFHYGKFSVLWFYTFYGTLPYLGSSLVVTLIPAMFIVVFQWILKRKTNKISTSV